jgi:hypothetical protein
MLQLLKAKFFLPAKEGLLQISGAKKWQARYN